MKLNLKIKGITGQWLINVLLVVVTVIFIFVFVLSLLLSNYYYNSVENYVTDILDGISDKYSGSSEDEYLENALRFVHEFEDKSKMEVQFTDDSGNIILSTSGCFEQDSLSDEMEEALESSSYYKYTGKNSAGEKIMSVLGVCSYRGEVMGAARCVVSMENVDRQIFVTVLITIAVGLLFIIFTVVLGIYFVGTITKPIRQVSLTARRIALGDLDARIDISQDDEIGELCDTINFMAGELKSAEKIKNDFISSVSHELRTPLTAIKGWGETIKSAADDPDPELINKGMDVIISESGRLSSLVEEMLDLSRLQSGQMSFKMERTDILAELAEAVIVYEETARSSKKELIYREPSELPPVIGDGNRLKQVFINLIDNALKYTDAGGHVIVSAALSDGYIKITVEDNGCGIPLAELDKVKERFYKATNSVRGSGIGLAVADEIIRRHNGLMFIESEEGAGTVVTVMLPAEPSDDAENKNI